MQDEEYGKLKGFTSNGHEKANFQAKKWLYEFSR
jgi:hypothetical protein